MKHYVFALLSLILALTSTAEGVVPLAAPPKFCSNDILSFGNPGKGVLPAPQMCSLSNTDPFLPPDTCKCEIAVPATMVAAEYFCQGLFERRQSYDQVYKDLQFASNGYGLPALLNLFGINIIPLLQLHFDMAQKRVSSPYGIHYTYIEGVGCRKSFDGYVSPPVAVNPVSTTNANVCLRDDEDPNASARALGVNLGKLNQAVDGAMAEPNPLLPYRRTAAIIVAYKGQVIAERYSQSRFINRDTRLAGASISKSVLNSLVGILVKQGKLSLSQKVELFPAGDARNNITLAELLEMRSGLLWQETYLPSEGPNVPGYDMFIGAADMGGFATSLPLVEPNIGVYSSGTSNIISLFIRKIIGNDRIYHNLLQKELFSKIGMTTAIFGVDASGTFVGSSSLRANARDYAKFGQIYLDKGKCKGMSQSSSSPAGRNIPRRRIKVSPSTTTVVSIKPVTRPISGPIQWS